MQRYSVAAQAECFEPETCCTLFEDGVGIHSLLTMILFVHVLIYYVSERPCVGIELTCVPDPLIVSSIFSKFLEAIVI